MKTSLFRGVTGVNQMKSKLNLFDLNQMYDEALNGAIDQETGEILEERLVSLLADIDDAKETKILNIVAFIKNQEFLASQYQGQIDYLKEELKARTSAQNVYLNKAKWLREYLNKTVEKGAKYADDRGSLHWTTSHSVKVDIEPEMLAKIRLDLCKIEPNKTAIKKAIEGGDLIIGCMIDEKKTVVIK